MSNERIIQAVYFRPEELCPTCILMEHSLEAMQELVDGYIERVRPSDYGVQGVLAKYNIWINEEGLIYRLPPNIVLNKRHFEEKNYDLAGVLVGPVLVCGEDNEGNTIDVDEADIPQIAEALMSRMLSNDHRMIHLNEMEKRINHGK